MVGLSRQEIWRRRRAGDFPEPIRLGGRRVGYPRQEIEAWIQVRVVERDRLRPADKERIRRDSGENDRQHGKNRTTVPIRATHDRPSLTRSVL
ncbi:MAG TPA: AlpA family phage regulatory protein [Candidatus Hydrogenedentes bacterium]|nr:AlpA family phage regulatory protein [Candidatus Hydrogenedentota bacterium]